jgi:signal transduction histidine kinase
MDKPRSRNLGTLFPYGRPAAARKEFFSLFSHIHRTPISNACGFIDLLMTGYAGQFNKAQRTYLVEARDSLHQLRKVIDAFLDLAAFDLGLVPRRAAGTDLAVFLRGAREEMAAWAVGGGREVRFRICRRSLRVGLEAQWLQTLVNELFSNALRVAPQGSSIEVRLLPRGGNAVLEVRDRGPGVPAALLERVLDPFYQLQGPRAPPRGERGGMGLALASRVVASCGGRLVAAPRPGGGLVMSAELPLKAKGSNGKKGGFK